MERELIVSNVKEIFWEVFDDKDLEIDDSTNAADIEEWDSLNHINLIVAIENEFKFKFTLEEIQSLKTVGDTIKLILHKI